MLDTIGPANCSRAVGRRIQDGTRYLNGLKTRVDQLEQIAEAGNFKIIVEPI